MTNQNKKKTCPICPNHCSEDSPKCEKGRSYFQGNNGKVRHHGYFQEDNHGRHGYEYEREYRAYRGRSHRGFVCKVVKDSLSGVMAQCGHHIFECLRAGKSNEDEIFNGLSEMEREELKKLLTKLLVSWESKN